MNFINETLHKEKNKETAVIVISLLWDLLPEKFKESGCHELADIVTTYVHKFAYKGFINFSNGTSRTEPMF